MYFRKAKKNVFEHQTCLKLWQIDANHHIFRPQKLFVNSIILELSFKYDVCSSAVSKLLVLFHVA